MTVPFHRHYDVTREVDLIEEVGRIHGYAENLPSSLPSTSGQVGRLTREQRLRRRAEDAMRDLGFDAVVNLSLTDPGMPGRLRIPDGDLRAEPIRVSNPLSAEHSVERTAVIGSLLDAASYNRAHGAERVALFESGRAYLREGSSPQDGVLAGKFVGERPAPAYEPWRIGSMATGAAAARLLARATRLRRTSTRSRRCSRRLARQLGAAIEVVPGEEPFLHPGRSGRVLVEGEDAGWIGEIHPLVCREWDLEAAAGFEVDLAPLVAASPVGRRDVRGRDLLSGRPPGRGGGRRRIRSRPPRSARPCSRAAASCCARPRSSISIAASRSARGARASPCGSPSVPPIGPSPTRRSRSAEVAIEAAVEKIGGSLRE